MQIGIDYTLFIQIAQFLVIVLLVSKWIVAPVHSTYSRRDALVKELNDRATDNLRQIEKKREIYEADLEAVRAELAEYSVGLRSEALARAKAITDRADAEAKTFVEAGRANIKSETDIVCSILMKQVDEYSRQILTDIVSKVSRSSVA
ncbi:hypothetical protein RsTz2092_05410 [Deferribacterales bacterium RsTz2092]|nr:hypothetical protein AGMMS49941_00540 [Deferribacterales bacterium]